MNIHVKRIDKDLPLPEYKTEGAAGFDLSARETVVIDSHAVGYVALNVVIEPPQGYFTLLVPRSSLHKRGLMPVNGVGIIDADYAGNDDELKAALYNFTEQSVTIERGERIMQGVFAPLVRPTFSEVEKMESATRGGFGTTGKK
jgi:dUTP pyrophosphatase